MNTYTNDAGFGYTLATGRLFCPVDEFHRRAEELIGGSIFTHEFASQAVWERLRAKFEEQATAAINGAEV